MAVAALAAGCDRRAAAPAAKPVEADQPRLPTPPRLDGVRLEGASLIVQGVAPAGAPVRLASPAGPVVSTAADKQGRWVLTLPEAPEARLFGLSALVGGRPLQAEGYVFVGPHGRAALLRAGGGAVRVDGAAGARLTAFDFDRQGGAIVSGEAPAGMSLVVELDGREAAQGRASADGRYAIGLNSPVPPARHELRVRGPGYLQTVQAAVTPAAPLVGGPLSAQAAPGGLRLDWMTPGGGVQSTLLFD